MSPRAFTEKPKHKTKKIAPNPKITELSEVSFEAPRSNPTITGRRKTIQAIGRMRRINHEFLIISSFVTILFNYYIFLLDHQINNHP
jgi:hypothetical protein